VTQTLNAKAEEEFWAELRAKIKATLTPDEWSIVEPCLVPPKQPKPMGRPSNWWRSFGIAVYCHALERRFGGGLESAVQETMTKFNVGARRSLRPASGGLVDAF
jgi:hypothetical protein